MRSPTSPIYQIPVKYRRFETKLIKVIIKHFVNSTYIYKQNLDKQWAVVGYRKYNSEKDSELFNTAFSKQNFKSMLQNHKAIVYGFSGTKNLLIVSSSSNTMRKVSYAFKSF